jgi:hypothetical protein
MEANPACTQDILKQTGPAVGANKQDFSQLAHKLVYGATHKVTTLNNQHTHQKDQENDLA